MLGLKSARTNASKEEFQPKGFDDFSVTLGDVMRGERATMGKSLMDVQRELKIKAAYIAAVEDADPSVFDTPGFIAGYVRSYAKYLELDPEWAFDKFCAESGFATIHGMSERALPSRMLREDRVAAISAAKVSTLERGAVPFMPPKESFWSRVNARAVGSSLILLFLIGGLGYAGYSVVQEVQQVQMAPVEQSPFVASDIDPLAPRQTQLSDQPDDVVPQQVATLERLYRPVALDVPKIEPRDGPIASLDPDQQGAFVVPTVPSPPQPTTVALGLPESGEPEIDAAAAVQVVEDAPKEIAFFSTDGVWLRVNAADGATLYEQIIQPGERFVLPQTEEPAVIERAGNPTSLYFQVNGVVYGPAGSTSSIVKGIELSETALTEGFVAIPEDQQSDVLRNALEKFGAVLASQ